MTQYYIQTLYLFPNFIILVFNSIYKIRKITWNNFERHNPANVISDRRVLCSYRKKKRKKIITVAFMQKRIQLTFVIYVYIYMVGTNHPLQALNSCELL